MNPAAPAVKREAEEEAADEKEAGARWALVDGRQRTCSHEAA
jgi:hypothetical protein